MRARGQSRWVRDAMIVLCRLELAHLVHVELTDGGPGIQSQASCLVSTCARIGMIEIRAASIIVCETN